MDDPRARPHDGKGRFARTLTTAEKEAEAARLRSSGWTYQRIADHLGWNNKGDAHHAVQKVLRDTVQEAGDDLRALELSRLDVLYVAATDVLERHHVTVSHGKIVAGLDGEPLLDDAPVLQAIDRLLRIQERRARLLGLDAPIKKDVSLTDERVAAIEALAEELAGP
ncbi:hypothetical protein [Streptomyces drozdowiczii]|uniref:hypothetical protein n=1 Tax=Streptomyces drozdowiczii TaxID=202862 RepID=UPI00403C5B81